MSAPVTLDVVYGAAIIRIAGTTHLNFRTDRFIGFQTWLGEDRYCIEITLDGGSIQTEYDTAEKWEAVISAIETATCSGRKQLKD